MRAAPGWRPSEEIEDGLPDGGHARLWRRDSDTFFPPCRFEAAGSKEGVGDHCHQGMSV